MPSSRIARSVRRRTAAPAPDGYAHLRRLRRPRTATPTPRAPRAGRMTERAVVRICCKGPDSTPRIPPAPYAPHRDLGTGRHDPRERHPTRENVPLADVLAGYPAISCVRAASERYGRRCHGAGAVAGASAVVACRPATALLTGCGGLYPDNVQKTSRNTFSAGLQRCGLSKSATKARIEPERARRIVDIPGFSSRPIPARGAFVADLDTPPPRTAPGVPPAPPHVRPSLSPRRLGPTDPDPQTAVPGKKGSMRAQLDKIHLSSHDVSSARQNPPELDSCELSSHNAS